MFKHNKLNLLRNFALPMVVTIGTIFPAYALEPSNKQNNLIITKDILETINSGSRVNFNNAGTFRGINGAERSIMISGKKYFYGINTKTYNKDSKSFPIHSIAANATLGFNFTVNDKGQRLLYEIWVLPKGLKLPFVTETLN